MIALPWKDKDEIVGNQTRVKVVKNKLAPPFKIVEFDIMYGEGISQMGEIVDLGVKAEIIDKYPEEHVSKLINMGEITKDFVDGFESIKTTGIYFGGDATDSEVSDEAEPSDLDIDEIWFVQDYFF